MAISRWQKVPNFVFADTTALPAPAMLLSAEVTSLPESFDRMRSHRTARGSVPLPETAPWPRSTALEPMAGKATLPVPAKNLFEITERNNVPINALLPLAHRAQLMSIDASAARRSIPGSMPVTPPGLLPAPVTR